MAQRWMQAKLILARRHGVTRSGCNRATGGVWDDIKIGYRDETVPGVHDAKEHRERQALICRKAVRPMAWGGGRKARRANLAG